MTRQSKMLSGGLFVAIVTMIALGCGSIKDLGSLTSRELYDQGMEKYSKKKYLRSLEHFQAILYNYPGESLVDTAQYYLALSYYGQKNYTLASVEFNRLLINYPLSAFAPEAQLMKAVCYYEGTPRNYGLDQSDLELAIEQFEDFLIDYPESEAAGKARDFREKARARLARKMYESGIVYVRLRDFRAAKIYFQELIDQYTDSEYAPLSAYQLAESNYQIKQWDSAHVLFDNFTRVFSEHELVSKARERACEAAFKGGEEAFQAGDYVLARTRFERHLLVCDGENDMSNEVNTYLEEIDRLSAQSSESADGGR